jgi:TfoX/Sxy family transcriptional regulator of competence genes
MDKAEKEARVRDMEMALRVALAAIRPEAHLDWKYMFGGAGFFVDGLIFAAWFGGDLTLKLPPDAGQELIDLGGNLQGGKYYEIPPGFLDHPEQLEPWIAHSLAFVSNPPSKKRR